MTVFAINEAGASHARRRRVESRAPVANDRAVVRRAGTRMLEPNDAWTVAHRDLSREPLAGLRVAPARRLSAVAA